MRPNRRETISLLAGVAPAALLVADLTNPDGEFEVLFRFYGPEKSLFEKKTWRLPDIEKT